MMWSTCKTKLQFIPQPVVGRKMLHCPFLIIFKRTLHLKGEAP